MLTNLLKENKDNTSKNSKLNSPDDDTFENQQQIGGRKLQSRNDFRSTDN